MLERMLRQEATITPRTQDGPPDEYDAPTWVDGAPTVELIHYQPISSDELAQRPGFRATYRAWLRSQAVIGVHSLVALVGGPSWEVEGEPKQFVNPRTSERFLEVDLVEVG